MSKDKMPKEIEIGVYYTTDEVGIIELDEESMQEEFENKLQDLQNLVFKLNKI